MGGEAGGKETEKSKGNNKKKKTEGKREVANTHTCTHAHAHAYTHTHALAPSIGLQAITYKQLGLWRVGNWTSGGSLFVFEAGRKIKKKTLVLYTIVCVYCVHNVVRKRERDMRVYRV